MKLWHLYYVKELDGSEYYYIPTNTKVDMLRSFSGGIFEIIHGAPSPSPESDWPDNEIIYNGKHTQKVVETLFKYGIRK